MAEREQLNVTHDPATGRFEIRADDSVAVLDYMLSEGRMYIMHTEVPPALEGRGIGSRLARAVLEHAKRENLRVIPQCWFVKGYIDRHPEYAPLVDVGA